MVGVTKVSFNWTTGATAVQLFSVTILSAGFVRTAPAAPLILFLSFPVGAIVALQKYHSWRAVD